MQAPVVGTGQQILPRRGEGLATVEARQLATQGNRLLAVGLQDQSAFLVSIPAPEASWDLLLQVIDERRPIGKAKLDFSTEGGCSGAGHHHAVLGSQSAH
jgi:hypothetical protein